jgi:arsenate reductase
VAGEVTIYHNPRCSTSRATLELIRAAGIEPTIVEYLKTPPSRAELAGLAARLGGPARALLRAKEDLAGELGLRDPAVGDAAVLDAMAAHPILIERPIVVSARGVRLGRPPEAVRAVLP